MSSKSEPKGDQSPPAATKDKTSGSGSKRNTNERNSNSNKSHQVDENSRKKGSSGSLQQNKHGGGKESRSRTGAGGRDSTYSFRPDRYKKDTYEHGSSNNKHGGGGGRGKEGAHGWSNHSRTHRYASESRKGHNKVHSSRSKGLYETNGNLDSGISVDENSSPEVMTMNAKITYRHSKHDKTPLQTREDVEDPMNGVGTGTDSTEGGENSEIDKKLSSEDLSMGDTPGSLKDESSDSLKDDTVEAKYTYDREFLKSLKDSTRSLMTPVGFEQLPQDIAKDILKAHHRHSGTDLLDDSPFIGDKDDDLPKHSNSLSLIREHDPKNNSKVSLMPQRRSFGSGCSWRDSMINKASSLSENQSSSPGTTFVDERGNEGHQNWTEGSQHNSTGPRIIDHIPYRSRQGEWKGTKSGWRDRVTEGVEEEEEEEPEWMSFGPSDRYEFMELKGIDEHEMEREARKVAEAKSKMKEEKSSPEESPSSSPLEKDVPKSDLVDSGLPSSCPNDEDDGFMLDGFDFKSVLSICQELASESGDDEPSKKSRNSLSTARDENQLTSALISVLGISKDGSGCSGEEEVTGRYPPPNQEQQQPMGRKPQLKAMTLDEIEGQNLSQEDVDQSAFNRFLASMEAKPSPRDTKMPVHTHLPMSALGPSPVRPLPKTRATRSLFADELEGESKRNVNPQTYQSDFCVSYPNLPLRSLSTPSSNNQFNNPPHSSSESLLYASSLPHQQQPSQGWPPSVSSNWAGSDSHSTRSHQLLNPSPSSLGMHPHHLRQHKQHLGGGSGGVTGGGGGGGGGNSSWVMEMEHLRISELNQMRVYPQSHHQYQPQHPRDERQLRMMQHQHSIQKGHSGGGSSPSLSFLPTSVMRHMHNSKSSQVMKDAARTSSHSASGRLDQEFLTDAAYATQHSAENPFHSSQIPPSHSAHHYQYPQPHHTYRSNLRGAPMDPLSGYQPPPQPSQIQQQYLRMGTKPNLY